MLCKMVIAYDSLQIKLEVLMHANKLTSTDIWKIWGVVRYEKVMVLEEASSGLKRDRNRLMMEVLAVPAPPTNRDACSKTITGEHTADLYMAADMHFYAQTLGVKTFNSTVLGLCRKVLQSCISCAMIWLAKT